MQDGIVEVADVHDVQVRYCCFVSVFIEQVLHFDGQFMQIPALP